MLFSHQQRVRDFTVQEGTAPENRAAHTVSKFILAHILQNHNCVFAQFYDISNQNIPHSS
jgi:hypothetical protein